MLEKPVVMDIDCHRAQPLAKIRSFARRLSSADCAAPQYECQHAKSIANPLSTVAVSFNEGFGFVHTTGMNPAGGHLLLSRAVAQLLALGAQDGALLVLCVTHTLS
jgi:hypothetical protein